MKSDDILGKILLLLYYFISLIWNKFDAYDGLADVQIHEICETSNIYLNAVYIFLCVHARDMHCTNCAY